MLEELESARLAARDLLHLQPRRVRARDGDRARRGQAAPHPRAAARRWTRPSATPSPTARPSRESPLNQTIFQALGMGVGLHHAGILPSVKRLIELLFERGLCRVVFATETMSLGIHMPARSVVLQWLTKRTDRGFRSLTHNELTQMAGRAGRRGIDPEGKCVIALDARDGLDDMRRVVDGSPEPIVSQFKLGYGSVALLLVDAARTWRRSGAGRVLVRPVPEPQADPRAGGRGAEPRDGAGGRPGLTRALRRLRAHRPLPAARAEVEARAQARGRGGPPRARSAAEAEPGRLALVRRKSGADPGLVARGRPARHRVLLDVSCPTAHVQLKEGNVKRVFWADAAARTCRATGSGAPAALEPTRWPPSAVRRADGARAERRGPRRRWPPSSAIAARGASRPRCEHAWKGIEGLSGGSRSGGRRSRPSATPTGRSSCAWSRCWSTSAACRTAAPRQGPAHRRPPARQRAAGGGDGRPCGSSRTPRPPRRRPLLVPDRGVALGRRRRRAHLPQEAAQAPAASSRRWAPSPTPSEAAAAPAASVHAHRHPDGVHAGGVPLGLGRRRLGGHRGGLVRRPRGRPDPGACAG